MSTNTVILGGLIHLSGFFFTIQKKHLPISPILLTAEAVWTTGLIYCPVLAVVTKHRDWLSDTPGQPHSHDLLIFLSLSVSWPFFAALVPSFLCPSLFPNKKVGHGYFSPLVTVFAKFIPRLGILQGNVPRESSKQLHSDFPPLPAPSWPLKTVQHVHSEDLKSNNASKTSSQHRRLVLWSLQSIWHLPRHKVLGCW